MSRPAVVVAPLGLGRCWSDLLVSAVLVAGLSALTALAVAHVAAGHAPLDRAAWAFGLVLCALVLRPVGVYVGRRLVVRAFQSGRVFADGGDLVVERRLVVAATRRIPAESIRAADVDDGTLWVLTDAGAEAYFDGRIDDGGPLAAVRAELRVPADPREEGDEALASYRIDGGPPRRCFVRVDEGLLVLRHRFARAAAVVVRACPAGVPLTRPLRAGTVHVGPDEVSWGPGPGGPTLRVRLRGPDGGATLSVAADRPAAFRQAFERFWAGRVGDAAG